MFPFLATGVTLMVYFLVIPRIKNIRKGLTITLLINMVGNIIFFVAPDLRMNLGAALFSVVLGTLVMAVGMGVSGPVIDAILANSVDEKTRAVTLSIVYTMMFGLSAPFGWFSGFLAELQPRYPALLMALLMFLSTLLALRLRQDKDQP
jgi:MFS family permease